MNNIPHFLSMLKAHKLLWAIIVSGNIDLVKDANIPFELFEEGPFKSYIIREMCLSDQDCFLNVLVSDDKINKYLEIKFSTKKMDYFDNVKKYFGSDKIFKIPMSVHMFKNIPDKPSYYYVIEFPNFEFPMYIHVMYYGTAPYIGKLTSIELYIPKSGKFESIKDVDPGSRIQVIPMKPIIGND